MADPLLKLIKKYEKANRITDIINLYKTVLSDSDPSDKTNYARCHVNIAHGYNKLGDYKTAENHFKLSYEAEPLGQTKYEMCFSQFNQGPSRLIEGFTNYGHRWDIQEMGANKFHIDNKCLIHAQDWKHIVGQRVMVVSEQGYGDEILFSRVIPHALKVVKTMGYSAKKELLPLFKYNYPEIEYMTNDEFVKPESNDLIYQNYDVIVTIGDIFRAYLMEFGVLPEINILKSDFDMEIEPKSIGYVWSAGNQGDNGHLRTIPENTIKYLGQKGFNIYNFQMGKKVTLGLNVAKHINNFLETASILNCIETVVTVDTSFAHLALNMCKKTILLHNKFLDWRWKAGLYQDVSVLSINDRNFRDKLVELL